MWSPCSSYAPDDRPQGVRVLVVDDEDYITDLIAVGLRFVGFEVDTAADGREALAKVASTRPDLVVLDISMPEIDGLEVLQRLRRDGVDDTGRVPHRSRRACRSGERPASRRRRLHHEAVQPRGAARPDRGDPSAGRSRRRWQRQITVDDLTIDRDGRDVRRGGQRIEMSRTEFNVLEFLMMNAGRVVSKQQILEYVWQYDFGGESTVVETYISYLRKKLDDLGPPMIHTMRRVGYVLRSPAEDSALSLRSRLVLVVLVLMTIGLIASDVATATSLRPYLLGRVDERLDDDRGVHRSPVHARHPNAAGPRICHRM